MEIHSFELPAIPIYICEAQSVVVHAKSERKNRVQLQLG